MRSIPPRVNDMHSGFNRSVWRGDGAAERASLENWRPRKGSASSNLAPSANESGQERNILCFTEIVTMFRLDGACVYHMSVLN